MTTYRIGNSEKSIKKVFFIILLLSMVLTVIAFYSIRGQFPLAVVICITIAIFLICFVFLTMFLSGFVRYMKVDDEKLTLVDTTQLRMQYMVMMNAIFHTHIEISCVEIRLDAIYAVQIYAVVDNRYTRLSGYDNNKEATYRVFMKLMLHDGSECFIQDWFYYKDPSLLGMFTFFSNKGINIIDHRNILKAIEHNLPLADYLNGKVTL